MRHKPLHNSICTLACAALLASAAQAAELGDIATRSYIGQPLAADIELVALAPDEVSGLQVRLAQADVYRGANVAMNPALSSVRMEVVKRDQRQFLHVTTTRAVNADYVHLYVALGAAGRQDVRLATVWLQADPNPPPPPAPPVPLASAMTPAQAEQIAAQARADRELAAKAAAAAVVAAVPVAPPVRDRIRPAPMPSVHESEVGAPGALRAAAVAAPEPVRRTPPASVRDLPERIAGVLVTPGGKPVKPSARQEGAAAEGAVPLQVAQALLPLPPLPLPKGVKRPASPAACAPSGMSARECVALDSHNAALSSKLVELESKMKALQGALGAARAPAARAAAAGPAPAPAAPGATAAVAHASAVAPAPAPAKAAAHASAAVPDKAPAKAAPVASAPVAAPASTSAKAASASASGHMEPEARAAKATASASAASASASVAAASEAASVPAKQVRVLPKLKYKKEKPVEKPADYTLPLAAGGGGLLALAGAGLIYLRKRKAGSGPLKIWQGFRKKKSTEPKPEEAQPLHEVTPESLMQ
jgi:pilus assembly protein FimV